MQGGTQLVQALMGGSLDFAVTGRAYLTGAVQGADLVMVATHMDRFPYSLLVKPAIRKVEDLKDCVGASFMQELVRTGFVQNLYK